MLNTLIANLATIRAIVSYRFLTYAIRDGLVAGRSLVIRHVLRIMALCSVLTFAPASASAQAFAIEYFGSAYTSPTGWWSPGQTGADAPHLQINWASLTLLETSDLLRREPASPNSYGTLHDLNGVQSQLEAQVVLSLVESEPLSIRTLLPLLEAKYAAWESSLADTRTLTNVNGVSVYPLAQVDYGQWHLPITLYISPLR